MCHNPNHVLPSVYMKKAPLTIIKNLLKEEKPNRQWYPKQSDIELQIYTQTFINLSERKRRKNLPLHHLVRISFLDDPFSKILELTGNWQLATAAKWQKQEKKEKRKKKAEKSKEIGSTFGHARTKKCRKTGCYCKERHAFMFNFE